MTLCARLNIGRLAPRCPVAVSDGSSVGCVYFAYGAGHAQNLFLAEGFSLVFTNTYVKNDYINDTYVNNTYVDRAFVLNLGCGVRGRLQPSPS